MIFEKYLAEAYPIRFEGSLLVPIICGGIPSDPKVAEGWLRTKISDTDDNIRKLVAETMLERNVPMDEALKAVNDLKHLNGFKQDEKGLYIEGRQLKAALKEAVSVALNAGKLDPRGWGKTNKGLISWFPEHVFVLEDRLYLGVKEPSGVNQKFVHTFRGSAIQYEEFVNNAKLDFTLTTDWELTERDWAMIWLTGQFQGIGASRAQGYGKYEITKWEKIKDSTKKPLKSANIM